MTLLAWIILAAIALAAVAYMAAEEWARRINAAHRQGYRAGRQAGLAEAGRLANVVAFDRRGVTR